jgi:hypothetical protein
VALFTYAVEQESYHKGKYPGGKKNHPFQGYALFSVAAQDDNLSP